MLLVSTFHSNFHSVLLYDQSFSSYRPFWDKCTKWPQMTLNPVRSNVAKCTPYMLRVSPIPKFQSVSLYDQPFIEISLFWKKGHWMTPTWPWTLQGQMYPIHVFLVSMSHKIQSVSLKKTQAVFKIQAIWDKCNKMKRNDLEPYKVPFGSVPNDLGLTLKLQQSKVPHIH